MTLSLTLALAAAVTATVTLAGGVAGASAPAATGDATATPACTSGTSWATTAMFADGVGSITGADYQRPLVLDDGRTLWMFQDAFVASASGTTLVHNAAAIESDGCFTALVGGTPEAPRSWIGADTTTHMQHWYWPLAGTQIDDDTYRVYLAEFTEPGDRYLSEAAPIATHVADVDLSTLTPSAPRPAPDASAELYGWSIVADREYRYLYGYCYRQFGNSPIGHHPCSADVHVARQPIDAPDAALEYWDGATWAHDPHTAANIAPTTGPFGETRTINPMQIAVTADGTLIAVTKEGDWWGDSLYLDTAPAPEGPWTTSAVIPVGTLDQAETTNTYFASFVPHDSWGLQVALSNNCWSAPGCDAYRPTVRTLPAQLWRPHTAVPVTDRTALPLGPPTGSWR